jgi:hypothetical protein
VEKPVYCGVCHPSICQQPPRHLCCTSSASADNLTTSADYLPAQAVYVHVLPAGCLSVASWSPAPGTHLHVLPTSWTSLAKKQNTPHIYTLCQPACSSEHTTTCSSNNLHIPTRQPVSQAIQQQENDDMLRSAQLLPKTPPPCQQCYYVIHPVLVKIMLHPYCGVIPLTSQVCLVKVSYTTSAVAGNRLIQTSISNLPQGLLPV